MTTEKTEAKEVTGSVTMAMGTQQVNVAAKRDAYYTKLGFKKVEKTVEKADEEPSPEAAKGKGKAPSMVPGGPAQ